MWESRLPSPLFLNNVILLTKQTIKVCPICPCDYKTGLLCFNPHHENMGSPDVLELCWPATVVVCILHGVSLWDDSIIAVSYIIVVSYTHDHIANKFSTI